MALYVKGDWEGMIDMLDIESTQKLEKHLNEKYIFYFANTKIEGEWADIGVSNDSKIEAKKICCENTIKAWCDGRTAGGAKGKLYYPPKNNCYSEKRYDR